MKPPTLKKSWQELRGRMFADVAKTSSAPPEWAIDMMETCFYLGAQSYSECLFGSMAMRDSTTAVQALHEEIRQYSKRLHEKLAKKEELLSLLLANPDYERLLTLLRDY